MLAVIIAIAKLTICRSEVETKEKMNMKNGYLEFFDTEDEAIEHCREVNKGLSSQDPNCCAVIPGPGYELDDGHVLENFAVVDLETAMEILDYPESGIAPLIVTDAVEEWLARREENMKVQK